jgi:hypothetical protein
MKNLLILLTILSIGASSLCETCIKATELLQNGLIKITPTFVAEDAVKSVCERQCICLLNKINQQNYARK